MAAATMAVPDPTLSTTDKDHLSTAEAPHVHFSQPSALTPNNDPFNPLSRPAADAPAGNFLATKMKTKNIFGNRVEPPGPPTWDTLPVNGASPDEDVDMGGVRSDFPQQSEDAPAAPQRRTAKSTLQKLGFDATRDGPRMRPPQLRNRLKSASDTTDIDDASTAAQGRRTQTNHKRTISGHSSQTTMAPPEADPNTSQPRRSNRLFSQITGSKTNATRAPPDPTALLAGKREDSKKVKATGAKGRGPSTVGRVVSGNRKVMPSSNPGDKESRAPSRNSAAPTAVLHKQPVELTTRPDTASLETLLAIFRSLGGAYYSLSHYSVSSSVEAFKSLPVSQRETPWVLAQLGKAHYEAADYTAAETCFAKMMKLQPTRIEDTEVYSNVLWQLKKPVQLAFLAHTLRDLDFNAPQTVSYTHLTLPTKRIV